nr:phosphotransferase [Sulfitobacter algicola]
MEFLANTDWKDAKITPLAGDASNRRYDRLTDAETGNTAVLMDADPTKGESIQSFIAIAQYLKGIGLSAPAIFAKNMNQGLLILEDLGDALYAKVVLQDPKLEEPLYEYAIDVLIASHRHDPPDGLAIYDPQIMADMACLSLDWYAMGVGQPVTTSDREDFHNLIKLTLDDLEPYSKVLIQRDYHAENLIWLPYRSDVARVGLLDFQDAMMGHPAYDLVSLLQDARRDVDTGLAQRMITRYVDSTDQDSDTFHKAIAMMGAQRNLRILGVFARLSMHFGKPHYVDFIPRVWNYLQADLINAKLKDYVDRLLPPPTPDRLQMLKDKCATIPNL